MKKRKYNPVKSKKKLPKYDDGGFFKKAGQALVNSAATYGNYTGSFIGGAVGNSELIPEFGFVGDEKTQDKWAERSDIVENIGGKAGQIGAQAALQSVGVPMGVTAAGQQVVGGATKGMTDEYSYKTDPTSAKFQQIEADKQFEIDQANLNNQQKQQVLYNNQRDQYTFAMGGKKCYPDGGKVAESIYPQGGQLPNAELEKEEVIQHIDGTTDQVDGPTHSMGGVDVKLEGGAKIFSDRLKTKDKITFAKAAEKFKVDKYEKILEDPTRDKLSKATARLMKEKFNKELDKLYNEQEALKTQQIGKEFDSMSSKFAKGGTITPEKAQEILKDGKIGNKNISEKQRKFFAVHAYGNPKYQQGGVVKPSPQITPIYHLRNVGGIDEAYKYNTSDTTNNPMGYTSLPSTTGGSASKVPLQEYVEVLRNRPNQILYGQSGDVQNTYQNPYIPNFENNQPTVQMRPYGGKINKYPDGGRVTSEEFMGSVPVDSTSGPNWGNIAFQGANFLGQNMGNLAYLRDQGKKYDTVNYGSITPQEVTPELMNVNPSLENARRMASNVQRGIRQGAVGGASYLSNIGASQAGLINTTGNIVDQYQNLNTGIKNQAQYANVGAKNQALMFNKQNQIQGMRDTAANRGQSLTNYYKAVSGIGENIGSQTKEIKQQEMDNNMLQLLRTGKYRYNPETNQVEFIK